MTELDDYICAHIAPQPDCLARIEHESNLRMVNGRMCSGHLQGRILRMFVEMVRPKRVLELGTFTGYSALCLAEGLEEGGRLLTVEADDELERTIRSNIAGAPWGDRVELRVGKAMDVLATLPDGEFDMAFVDADKREYPLYYPEVLRVLRKGGYMLADNTLWDGHVADPSRHDPQTEGVRRFNAMAAADPGVSAVILPVRDGLSVIRKL